MNIQLKGVVQAEPRITIRKSSIIQIYTWYIQSHRAKDTTFQDRKDPRSYRNAHLIRPQSRGKDEERNEREFKGYSHDYTAEEKEKKNRTSIKGRGEKGRETEQG